MSNIEKVPWDSELDLHIPIAPDIPEEIAVVLRAAIGLKAEIDSIDSALLTSADDPRDMPNQPVYGAGDVTVVTTKLRRINTVMFEVEYKPDTDQTNGEQRSYGFVLPIEITADGVKPQKEYSGHINMRKSEDGDEIPKLMSGSHGMRAQEIILRRAIRQLQEERASRNTTV